MTEIAGATSTYDMSAANREDLWDIISNISPMDRPFTSNIPRVKAKATRHDWLTDSLASATSNMHLEGDVTSFSTAIAVTKLANTCQILKKAFVITGTQEAVDKAGRKSEI